MEPNLVVPFGRYVLQARMGQGGMGEVFRAVAVGEHGFEKPVVIKRVLPAHAGREDLADLFVAEAKLMTRLAHPNIVEVLDFGRGEHRDYYLVLELVEGTDLGRLMRATAARGEAFPVPLALFIASQVLRGLHHAHTRSETEGAVVVHRDVSPSNVLCSAEGEVKVADFGVALVTHVTQPREGGGVVGKPGYIAPEQFDGGALDARADVFSVGVILHQMLTGELPFRGEDVHAQRAATRKGERVPVNEIRADVAAAVDAIVGRALAPSRDDRWPDARSMAQAIEKLRDEGQPLASGDDLAEAVRAAQREQPAPGRPVIALSAGSASTDDEPRELTRTSLVDGGLGAFTLRFPARGEPTTQSLDGPPPEPRTEKIEPVEPSRVERSDGPANEPAALVAPERTRGRAFLVLNMWLVGAGVAVTVLLAVAKPSWFAPPRPLARPSLTTRDGPLESAQSMLDADPDKPSPVPSASAEAHDERPLPAVPASGAALPPRVVVTAPFTATPSTVVVTAAPTQSAAAGCSGEVAFASDGSWIVNGGPSSVQTPVIVTWPCGSYSLTARSRFDPPQEKTATVTVGPLKRSSVDLRR